VIAKTADFLELAGPIPADLVLAERVYVRESVYEVGRARVAELMRAVIALPSIVVDHKTDTGRAGR
jgi:hypothetical protein